MLFSHVNFSASCILISQEKGLKLKKSLIEIAETRVVWMKEEGCFNSNWAVSFQYMQNMFVFIFVFGKYIDLLTYLVKINSTLKYLCLLSQFNHVWFFAIPWTIAFQASLSIGFSRQEYWVGCYFLLQGIFPTQGLSPRLLGLLHWQAGSLELGPPGKYLWT